MSNNIHYNKSYKDHIFDKDKDKDNDKDNYIDSIHYLNVDTRLINKGSVNILNNEYIKTDNNISFTENSSILNINISRRSFAAPVKETAELKCFGFKKATAATQR